MEISQDFSDIKVQIQSYQAGKIKINGQEYQSPLILTASEIDIAIHLTSSDNLSLANLEQLKIEKYEVILIGTGSELKFLDWDLMEQAQVKGTPLEVMATDAACRTFTILASESRNILALLFP